MNTEIFSSQWKHYGLSKGRHVSQAVEPMKTRMDGTCVPSLTITFVGRRRHTRGRCRVWTPLPHYPGLSQTLNPMPYPPQVNFPPPPIMTPIPIGVPPPPYSLPLPPILALLMPAPPVTQAVAPAVQANMASITIPTPAPVVNSVALATAPVIVVGETT